MSVKWIEHKGKRILYGDFRGLKGEQALDALELVAKKANATPGKLVLLYNFEGATASPEFMARVKQLGKEVFAVKVDKVAAVGITGVKAVLVEAYNKFTGRDLRTFKTEAEALDWLVKD